MPIPKSGFTGFLTLTAGFVAGLAAAGYLSGKDHHDSTIESTAITPTSTNESRAENRLPPAGDCSPARPIIESGASQNGNDGVAALRTDVGLTESAVPGSFDASADPSPEGLAESQATEQITSVHVVPAEIEQLELELAAQSQSAPASMTTEPDEGLLAHEKL